MIRRKWKKKNVWWLPRINTACDHPPHPKEINENRGKHGGIRWEDGGDELNTSREARRYFDRGEAMSTLLPRMENHGRNVGKEQFFWPVNLSKGCFRLPLSSGSLPLSLMSRGVTSRVGSATAGKLHQRWSSSPVTGYFILTKPRIKN